MLRDKLATPRRPAPSPFASLMPAIRAYIDQATAAIRAELSANLDSLVTTAIDKLASDRLQKLLKGEKGESVVGPRGERGTDGYTPVKGVDYFDGEPGKTPIKGVDYFDGAPGVQGKRGGSIKGDKGADGSPDTPDQVIEKVNSSKLKIAATQIAGLPEQLRELARRKKSGGQSGGGMGNWLHESFSVSSATTNVTTTARAAANGTAHILRYNGQVLAYGSQYTVSGKLYSFTFTLDDDSTVDISYVRS